MISELSKKIGFTTTEVKVILFFTGVFLAGYAYKEFFDSETDSEYTIFDYSEQDSLFNYYSGTDSESPEGLLSKNDIDIKREVLELSPAEFSNDKNSEPLTEKSINLNSAGIADLVKMPGIGEKTAENIIALRNIKGRFKTIEELMEVKGIGEVKFNKIKKFLYIE